MIKTGLDNLINSIRYNHIQHIYHMFIFYTTDTLYNLYIVAVSEFVTSPTHNQISWL